MLFGSPDIEFMNEFASVADDKTYNFTFLHRNFFRLIVIIVHDYFDGACCGGRLGRLADLRSGSSFGAGHYRRGHEMQGECYCCQRQGALGPNLNHEKVLLPS